MHRLIRLTILFPAFLSALSSFAQAPDISYGDYKFFNLESDATTVVLKNRGGSIPPGRYGATSTYVGTNNPSLKNGKAEAASFKHPTGIAASDDGTLYVVEEGNNSIRKISREGLVTTIASGFNSLAGITIDVKGNIYVAEVYQHRIRRISVTGEISTFAGNGNAGDLDHKNGLLASFRYPVSLASDTEGNIYVSDEGNHKIRKIRPDGAVSTLAGTGRAGDSDDLDGTRASFNQPAGIAVDAEGYIYVADQLNHKIRVISPTGTVTTLAGIGFAGSSNETDPLQSSFNNPRAVAIGSGGWIYICDTGNQLIRRIGPDKQVSTLAGSGAWGATDHPDGSLASFYFPADLVETDSGLFVADCLNNRIRKIATTGFQIVPAILPPGIHFDYSSGSISAEPEMPLPGQTHRITAYNHSGNSSTDLTFSASYQPGNALKFDGIDDIVVIQNNPVLTPDVVTVELWVKVGKGLPNHRFILKRNTLPHFDESYSLGVNPDGQFELLMSSGTGLVGSQVRIHNKIMPVPNKWYFVSGVFSAENARLYIDSELTVEAFSGFPISKSNNGLFLNFDERSRMTVDEVRLFNYDRSPMVKQDMMQPISPDEPGLIAYYDFNMGIAGGLNRYTTLYDKSANGLNGEMQQFYPAPGTESNWVESYAMVVPRIQPATQVSRNSFRANWNIPAYGFADHYLLDVATDSKFADILPGYKGKQVAGTQHEVHGLQSGTSYYYRVSAYKAATDEIGGNSMVKQVITAP